MNHSEISPIQHNLQMTLSENKLTRLAELSGFLTRHRKILPHSLVVAVLTALGKDCNAESLADLHRKFNEMTGLNVSCHAWREQVYKPEFLVLMVWLSCDLWTKMVKRTLSFDKASPLQDSGTYVCTTVRHRLLWPASKMRCRDVQDGLSGSR